MFARFKKFLEPIERPYCYLLLVTCYHWGWRIWATEHVFRPYCYLLFVIFWGGEFGPQNMCYDLIVSC